MSNSRRGLTAAGLAVAMVGALGVASTLNAAAEQVPDVPDAGVGSVVAAVDATLEPPPLLPWGAVPEEVSTGDPGATSNALRAEGLDAAPADASGDDEAAPGYAPKGQTARNTFLKSTTTNVVPPQPAGTGSADSTVTFLYNVGSQPAATDGVYANVTIGKPELDPDDYHTLAELAVQSADGKQIVEVGWNVDRVVNKDSDPHLFVYHWVNGQTTCYNACGFVPYSSNVKPGDTLAHGATKQFGIQFFKGAWWVAFDSEWVGYFPASLWSDKGVSFTRSGLVQVFGEVAASSTTTCTDMGNGLTPDKEAAARFSSVSFVNGPTVALDIKERPASVYAVNPVSSRTFRYGGPGAC